MASSDAHLYEFELTFKTLYDSKTPVSRSKIQTIADLAVKAQKYYKHVVMHIETFIRKSSPKHKLPGIYVIDALIRLSMRHYGKERDVFARRLEKNLATTFTNAAKCADEDKFKVFRCFKLWKESDFFGEDAMEAIMKSIEAVESFEDTGMHKRMKTNDENNAPIPVPVVPMTPMSPVPVKETVKERDRDRERESVVKSADSVKSEDHREEKAEKNREVKIEKNREEKSEKSEKNREEKVEKRDREEKVEKNREEKIEKSREEKKEKLREEGGWKEVKMEKSEKVRMSAGKEAKAERSEKVRDKSPGSRSPGKIRFDKRLLDFDYSDEDEGQSDRSGKRGKRRGEKEEEEENYFVVGKNGKPEFSVDKIMMGLRRQRGGSELDVVTPEPVEVPKPAEVIVAASPEPPPISPPRPIEIDSPPRVPTPVKPQSTEIILKSCTIWIGHLAKGLPSQDLKKELSRHGDVKTCDVIPSRGCAYISFAKRSEAEAARSSLRDLWRVFGDKVKVSWSPGKGIKDGYKSWDWDQYSGICKIPVSVLPPLAKSLIEGSELVEESVPDSARAKLLDIEENGDVAMEEVPEERPAPVAAPVPVVPAPPPQPQLPVISLPSASSAGTASAWQTTAVLGFNPKVNPWAAFNNISTSTAPVLPVLPLIRPPPQLPVMSIASLVPNSSSQNSYQPLHLQHQQQISTPNLLNHIPSHNQNLHQQQPRFVHNTKVPPPQTGLPIPSLGGISSIQSTVPPVVKTILPVMKSLPTSWSDPAPPKVPQLQMNLVNPDLGTKVPRLGPPPLPLRLQQLRDAFPVTPTSTGGTQFGGGAPPSGGSPFTRAPNFPPPRLPSMNDLAVRIAMLTRMPPAVGSNVIPMNWMPPRGSTDGGPGGVTDRSQSGNLIRPPGGQSERPQSGSVERPQSGPLVRPPGGLLERQQSGSTDRPPSGPLIRPPGGQLERQQSGSAERPPSGMGVRPVGGSMERPQGGPPGMGPPGGPGPGIRLPGGPLGGNVFGNFNQMPPAVGSSERNNNGNIGNNINRMPLQGMPPRGNDFGALNRMPQSHLIAIKPVETPEKPPLMNRMMPPLASNAKFPSGDTNKPNPSPNPDNNDQPPTRFAPPPPSQFNPRFERPPPSGDMRSPWPPQRPPFRPPNMMDFRPRFPADRFGPPQRFGPPRGPPPQDFLNNRMRFEGGRMPPRGFFPRTG